MESGSPRAVAVEMSSHGLNSTGWDFVSGFAAGVTELITPCQWNQPGAWQFVCLSLFFLCLPSKCNREWSNEPRLGMSWFAPSALFSHCILPAWQVQLGSGLSLLCSAPFRWCQGLPVPGDSSLMPLLLPLRCTLLGQCAGHTKLWKEERKPKSAYTPRSLALCEEII